MKLMDGDDAVEPTKSMPEHLVRLALRFARCVEADPDFELAGPLAPGVVCFRAAPHGLDAGALDALNADLLGRVNATAELCLSPIRLGGRYALRLGLGRPPAVADIPRAWEVVTDAFHGILVDSTDPNLRWDFQRTFDPAAA